MNSQNSLNTANDSIMGTLIMYAFIAVVFFYIGRNYESIRNQVEKRIPDKKSKVCNNIV
jgi:predicted PurR-regulated permease PerM